MSKLFIAKVYIVFPVPDNEPLEDGYMSDTVSETLTGNLMHNGAILDWAYVRECDVIPFKNENPDYKYQEGDLWDILQEA
jgi:hypothetical protein